MADADNVFVISDPWPVPFFFFCCLSPFSNIYIILSAQVCMLLNACVCFSECVSGRLGGLGHDLGLPQRDCLDTAFFCLTELSGMFRYGEKKADKDGACMHECALVFT